MPLRLLDQQWSRSKRALSDQVRRVAFRSAGCLGDFGLAKRLPSRWCSATNLNKPWQPDRRPEKIADNATGRFVTLTALTANEAPPPSYYADNLRAVVTQLSQHQSDVLGDTAAGHARLIQGLADQPLRLLARLITRTTAVIRYDSLNYAEIDDTRAALTPLYDAELVVENRPVAGDLLLARLRVAELRRLFPRHQKRCKTKSQLQQMVIANYGEAQIHAIVAEQVTWVGLCIADSLQRMLVSYFGSARGDFSDFVIRDLGLVRFEDYSLSANSRVFDQAEDAQRYLDLLSLQRLPIRQRPTALPWLQQRFILTHTAQRPLNPDVRRRQDRLLIGWGRDFERNGDTGAALSCFAQAHAHPARERQVRILRKLAQSRGQLTTPAKFAADDLPSNPAQAARNLLRAMREAPVCLLEAQSAEKLVKTGGVAQSSTQAWRETHWRVSRAPYPNVERRVLQQLTSNGGAGWHVENALFSTLLGLAFWECIFAPVAGMFSHPFQSGPRDLYWPDFRSRRESLITQCFRTLREPGALWQAIHRSVGAKFGVSCALVSWSLTRGDVLSAVQQRLSVEQLLGVFDYMLTDLSQTRSGLPDLFVAYPAQRFELVEVKGPGDQLQPNQRIWLNQLCALNIPCRVISLRASPA